MTIKDRRLRLMTEVISGIKVGIFINLCQKYMLEHYV